MIPNQEYFCLGQQYSFGSAQREPHVSLMKAGILEEITYPTGGKTSFISEGHRLQNNDLVGGLRIKKQESYDENGIIALEKTYTYLNPRLFSNVISYLNDPQNSPWGGTYGIPFNQSISSNREY